MIVGNLEFVKTCGGCPEQYDVFYGDFKKVAYARLRHGYFYVSCPNSDGEVVYDTDSVRGDGIFYDDHEREIHLKRAAKEINEFLRKTP